MQGGTKKYNLYDFVCGSRTPRSPAKAANRSRVETSERGGGG